MPTRVVSHRTPRGATRPDDPAYCAKTFFHRHQVLVLAGGRRLCRACHPNVEIAEEIGYDRTAVSKFLDSIQYVKNGADAENHHLSENAPLTQPIIPQGFEDEEAEDANSLGVYTLDKRLLIKASHVDEHYKPPIYNVWKQQEKTPGSRHFGNSEVRWLDNLLYLYTQPHNGAIPVRPWRGPSRAPCGFW